MSDLQTELMRRSFEIFIRQNRRKSHLARLCVNEKVVKYACTLMQSNWEQWQQAWKDSRHALADELTGKKGEKD